jgi:hypothetical protein
MPQDRPNWDQPTQRLPSQDRASSDQPTQQLPSQTRASSNQPTQQLPSIFQKDPQTRRLFLKAAIISGAAVATVGATGAAASASPQLLRQLRGEPATASGAGAGVMCFENSAFHPITSFTVNSNGKTQPGTFFVWFTAPNLPAGAYSYTLTSSPGGAPGDNTTPFMLSDSGNNVYVFPLAGGSCALTGCPGEDPLHKPPAGHSIGAPLFPFTTTKKGDLRIRVHIKYSGGPIASNVPYTFAGTLTNTNTLATYTGQIGVTAKPKV